MKRLLTLLRTFCETWFGTCDLYINSRGKITGHVTICWFAPREIDLPTESTQASKFIPVRTYTPPALLTRIHYVLPSPQSQPNSPHIPIRPVAPCTETIHLDLPNNPLPTL